MGDVHLAYRKLIWLGCYLTVAFRGEGLQGQVVINEVLASNARTSLDEDSESSDWIELFNPGARAVDLSGHGLSDDRQNPWKWEFPAGASIASGGYVLIWCSGKDRTEQTRETIEDPDIELVFRPEFVTLEDSWRYLTGLPEDPGPPALWSTLAFNDSQWPSGKPGFGFGDDDDETLLPEDIGAVFLRRVFSVDPAAASPSRLVLRARFDDGFIAYLNGKRVLSVNFPEDEEPGFASLSTRSREARDASRFDLSSRGGALLPGENVLAMVLLNRRVSSNDLSLIPELGTVPPVYHTNFKLDRAGETLSLTRRDGVLIDIVTLPPQIDDQSYGRVPSGTGDFLYLLEPSPAAANEGPAGTEPLLVEGLVFSVERGFHDQPFSLEITTATPDAVIRYTLDGLEPTATHGSVYGGPIPVSDTTTIRAAAFKSGLRPTDADAHTYLFLETPTGGGILNQPRRPAGWPATWGPHPRADYEMDQRVVSNQASPYYDERVREGLLSHPSICLIMDLDDLFDPATGIYTNPQAHGDQWERPTSVEIIHPSGDRGIQANAGIRLMGNASRSPTRPKHNMRLVFRRDYGPTRLRYPVFEDSPVEEFDTLVLRGGNGDSWFHPNATQRMRAQYIRDQWHRDVEKAMGQPTTYQAYYHLYINGLYWGLYHVFERPNAEFLSSHFGGEEEEYDAINGGEVIDGDLTAYNRMMSIAGGGMASAQAYEEIQQYLDVQNLIDFLLINFHSGNVDWDRKNWYGGRRRVSGAGYMFFCWDAERTFWNLNENRTNLNLAGKPTGMHQKLRANAEYRVLFGDRVYRHLFNDGALTPRRGAALWKDRADEIRSALAAESARWGDDDRAQPYSVDREWTTELNSLLGNWFPNRTGIVLNQLKTQGLYPEVEPPTLSPRGGRIAGGSPIAIDAVAGSVFYTLDGSDPRSEGGEVSETALAAALPQARILLPEGAEARFHVPTGPVPGAEWTSLDFDDGAWATGKTGFGFETRTGYEEFIETDVGALMHDSSASIYLRFPFEVGDPAAAVFLRLQIRYDDGFVAFLNGRRVASRNAPDSPQWNSSASRSHGDRIAVQFEIFDLPGGSEVLRRGRNVLAIQGLNRTAGDGDFLIEPVLETKESQGALVVLERSARFRARTLLGGEWSALHEAVYVVREDYPLHITELMYHPRDPEPGGIFDAEEFEFIELKNVGERPINLSGLRLTSGIFFDFATSGLRRLPPGEFILVVRNAEAFRSRYEVDGLRIAGEYANPLSNSGEMIRLEGPIGETILELDYRDSWHGSTDGDGASLVLVSDGLSPELTSDPESWRPSARSDGSPGEDDDASAGGGSQLPGDANQDGRLNLGDAVRILVLLFVDASRTPCDGAGPHLGANRGFLDVNGDREVDVIDAIAIIRYLYLSGPAPAHGVECVRMSGCPEVCRTR